MKNFFLSFILVSTVIGTAQIAPTQKADIQKALQQKESMDASSLVKNIPFKNIGPSIMSGRVVDIDVNPSNPTEFYVGYASGGLWYTADDIVIGPVIWGSFATIQTVENDPGLEAHGLQYLSDASAGFGYYMP